MKKNFKSLVFLFLIIITFSFVLTACTEVDPQVSIHDFRMVVGEKQINLIFDMVVPIQYDKEQKKLLCQETRKRIHEIDERYQCVIVVESSFVAGE